MAQNNNQGRRGCGIGLGTLLLLVGGIMYGICKDAGTNGTCGGNTNIAEVGYILLFVGVGLYAAAILILIIVCCCEIITN